MGGSLRTMMAGMLVVSGLLAAGSAARTTALLRAEVGVETPATATMLSQPSSQNSPMVLADPTDARFVVLAHRQDAPSFGCGLQVSGDGGRSWIGVNPVPALPEGADVCYAPEVVFDDDSRLYYLFIALAGLGNNPTGVYLVTSDDHGRTFTPPRQVLGPSHYQVRMAIDPGMGARGRIHIVWLKAASDSALGGLTPDPNPLFASYSDDGGQRWSAPVQVSDTDRPRAVAPAIVVAPDHTVHIAYYDLRDDVRDYQGLEGPPWDGDWSVVVTSSTDRGRGFGRGVVVDGEISPPGRVMLIYTMPPPALAADSSNRVLVAWTDGRTGDPDVYLSWSADGGRSFAPAQRVNDDPVGNGKDQYLPRLGAAPSGRVDLAFLDRRDDPANVLNDTYLAWTEDGGRSLSPNTKLTSQSSDSRIGQRYLVPSAEGLYEMGGRIGVLSRSTSAIVAWPDTRNSPTGTAQQDVFTTTVRFLGAADADGRGGGGLPVVPLTLAGVGGAAGLGVFFLRRRGISSTTAVG